MCRRGPIAFSLVALCLSVSCAKQAGTDPAAAVRDDLGRFVWQDLVTDDVDACRRFYGALLGWEFEEIDRLGKPYTLVRNNGSFVAGIAAAQSKNRNEPISQWLSYLLVTDVEGAVESNRTAGGAVFVPPVQLTEDIRAAVVTDPLGAPFGLVAMREAVSILPTTRARGRSSGETTWPRTSKPRSRSIEDSRATRPRAYRPGASRIPFFGVQSIRVDR